MKREEFIEWLKIMGFNCRSSIHDINWRNLGMYEIYPFHNLAVNENKVKFNFDKFSFGFFDETITILCSFDEFVERYNNNSLKD